MRAGAAALVLALAAWALLAVALVAGGLDPAPHGPPQLVMLALGCVLGALVLGAVGIARASQRRLAIAALVVALLFAAAFVGGIPL